jgi:hypothetical protein
MYRENAPPPVYPFSGPYCQRHKTVINIYGECSQCELQKIIDVARAVRRRARAEWWRAYGADLFVLFILAIAMILGVILTILQDHAR